MHVCVCMCVYVYVCVCVCVLKFIFTQFAGSKESVCEPFNCTYITEQQRSQQKSRVQISWSEYQRFPEVFFCLSNKKSRIQESLEAEALLPTAISVGLHEVSTRATTGGLRRYIDITF